MSSKFECVYTRAECHHNGYKCSECPITELVCDEFTECLDLSYEQGRIDERARCIKILEDNWLCGTVARRVIDDIIEQLKEQNK